MNTPTHTKTHAIVVTRQDLDRLREMIRQSRLSQSESDDTLRTLELELQRAEIVDPHDVPDDVVTMNSTVRVRMKNSKQSQEWTVVYPHDADFDEGRISVLAPMGTALLGYRAGDTFEWNMPAGRRSYRIIKIVHQPESSGEWDR